MATNLITVCRDVWRYLSVSFSHGCMWVDGSSLLYLQHKTGYSTTQVSMDV